MRDSRDDRALFAPPADGRSYNGDTHIVKLKSARSLSRSRPQIPPA